MSTRKVEITMGASPVEPCSITVDGVDLAPITQRMEIVSSVDSLTMVRLELVPTHLHVNIDSAVTVKAKEVLRPTVTDATIKRANRMAVADRMELEALQRDEARRFAQAEGEDRAQFAFARDAVAEKMSALCASVEA